MKRKSQIKWDTTHPETIKKSKNQYDRKRPVWSFRPSEELIEWLEKERGDRESNAALLARKLVKLMELEREE
ncbi:MAG: hypothetical protein QNJ54_30280 [Prochloraceae cyanobacterium]|nr:hypothetical protein [Prochloraceae cyanobacterium]